METIQNHGAKKGMKFRVEIRSDKECFGPLRGKWCYQGDSRTLANAEKLASQMRSHGEEARVLILG